MGKCYKEGQNGVWEEVADKHHPASLTWARNLELYQVSTYSPKFLWEVYVDTWYSFQTYTPKYNTYYFVSLSMALC